MERYLQAESKIGGYVLAGGNSSRFGSNRALQLIDDKPLILHVSEAVSKLATAVTIVSGVHNYQSLGLTVIPDRVSGRGPLGGIISALEHSSYEWNLIVACDMPLLAAAPLESLVKKALNSSAEVITPRTPDGLLQPLCAMYSKSALEGLLTALLNGTRKLSVAFQNIRWELLEVDDDLPYLNINHPDDLDKLT